MKINTYVPAQHHALAAVFCLAASLFLLGCNKPKPVAAPPVAPGNSAQKLTASEVATRIKAVQANTTLPESAKPSIIESIRAQGQP